MGAGAPTAGFSAVLANTSPEELKACLAEIPEEERARVLAALNTPAPTVKVHGLPASQGAMSAILTAMHTGCGDMEMCNIMEGDQMKPEFLAMNPFHHIPTMKDGDFAIGESSAICRYIAMKYMPELYPVNEPETCARIDFAMDSFNTDVYTKLQKVVYVVMGFGPAPEDQAAANKEFSDAINTWCTHFLQGKFVCGDKLSIADLKVVPFLFAANQPGVKAKLGFADASGRSRQYVEEICTAVSASAMLKEAGGFSIAEYIAGKVPDAPPLPGFVNKDYAANAPVPKTAGAGKVKIFGLPVSANTVGPVLLAMDSGAGALEQCDIMSGAQMTPEFLAMNPFHHIPTMQDGELAIGESNAILRYLALKYKPEYYPVADVNACGQIDFAMDSFACDVYKKMTGVLYTVMEFAAAPADQAAANKEFTEALDTWMNHFCKGKFVCGDKLTIADFKAAPFLFAIMQPAMESKVGFKANDRVTKYVEDFCTAVASSALLKSAGGFSLAEYIASKA